MIRSLTNQKQSEASFKMLPQFKVLKALFVVLFISLSCVIYAHVPHSIAYPSTDGIPNNGVESLALSLTSFSGKSIKNGNHLIWQITSSIGRKDFEVERSTNGRDWKLIGNIARHPANLYEALDSNPMSGNNYYRIKQTDNAGRPRYSRTIKIYWK